MGTWTTPDAYAGDASDPMSRKSYMWNRNNSYIYSDHTGYSVTDAIEAGSGEGIAALCALVEPCGVGVLIGIGVVGAGLGAAYLINRYRASQAAHSEEHASNPNPANLPKHERGEARKTRDYGTEKGDKRRGKPRKPPDNWKGPWPPVNKAKQVDPPVNSEGSAPQGPA